MLQQDQQAVFIADLIKTVEDMIPVDRRAGFDVSLWMTNWLVTPQPALSGHTPRELMASTGGRATVRRLLDTMESGAYV